MGDSQNYSLLDPADADSYGSSLAGRVVIITGIYPARLPSLELSLTLGRLGCVGAASGFGRAYAIKAARLGYVLERPCER